MVPLFVNQFQELVQLIPIGIERLGEWLDSLMQNSPFWLSQSELESLPSFAEIYQQLGSLAPKVFSNFFSFFSNPTAIMLQLLLVAVLTLMFLADPLAYRSLST